PLARRSPAARRHALRREREGRAPLRDDRGSHPVAQRRARARGGTTLAGSDGRRVVAPAPAARPRDRDERSQWTRAGAEGARRGRVTSRPTREAAVATQYEERRR